MELKPTQGLSENGTYPVPARLVEEDGEVLLCRQGVDGLGLVEVDPDFFTFTSSRPSPSSIRFPSVILHISNRCNLRCPLCYEGGELPKEEPGLDELQDFTSSLPRHTVLVLGGLEPTCRPDLPDLIRSLSRTHPTRLLTNGLKLTDLDYTGRLKDAGLGGVSLALNGLNDDVHQILNGRPLLEQKMAALENCASVGLPCVLSMVLARGINEDQIGPMVRFGIERSDVVESLFVRTATPVGRSSRHDPYCLSEMVALLAKTFGEPVDPFLDEMRMMVSVFDAFGTERCRPKTCAAELHVRQVSGRIEAAGRRVPGWARRRPPRSRIAVAAAVAATYGIRYPMGQLSLVSRLPFSRRGSDFFRISLRSWPHPANLDLEENRKCTTAYYRNGRLDGFCKTNATRKTGKGHRTAQG